MRSLGRLVVGDSLNFCSEASAEPAAGEDPHAHGQPNEGAARPAGLVHRGALIGLKG